MDRDPFDTVVIQGLILLGCNGCLTERPESSEHKHVVVESIHILIVHMKLFQGFQRRFLDRDSSDRFFGFRPGNKKLARLELFIQLAGICFADLEKSFVEIDITPGQGQSFSDPGSFIEQESEQRPVFNLSYALNEFVEFFFRDEGNLFLFRIQADRIYKTADSFRYIADNSVIIICELAESFDKLVTSVLSRC